MNVEGNHPLAEIIACKLFSIETCPASEQRKMVNRAVKEAVEYHTDALASARKEEAIACAEIANERARKMNILGWDKDMVQKMTHACIQAERVYEAKQIATEILSRNQGR